jgi:hypothetical protein
MRTLILIFFIACCPGLQAQQTLSASGGTFENSNGAISFTIGESIALTFIKGDNTLTQGFHQTKVFISLLSEAKDLDFLISVFPNPAADGLILKIGLENISGLKYLLFDINGKLLTQKELEYFETRVPISQLADGLYIIKVLDGINEIKSFKIIKK